MTERNWTEGDLVLRVGPTRFEANDPNRGEWTAGKVYILERGVCETLVRDDEGVRWSGPGTSLYNKFVSFDDLYSEALVEDRTRRDVSAGPPSDPIHQPKHYARFAIEPITFINANALPYNIGNVIKYACRYDAKNGVEDLEKAKRYLDIHIETLRRRERVAAGESPVEVWKDMI